MRTATLLWLVLLVNCKTTPNPNTCIGFIRSRIQLNVEHSSALPDASLLALRVVDWGDSKRITAEVAPGHLTTLVPGADQAGYPPGLATMASTRWRLEPAGPRPPVVELLGECQSQAGG